MNYRRYLKDTCGTKMTDTQNLCYQLLHSPMAGICTYVWYRARIVIWFFWVWQEKTNTHTKERNDTQDMKWIKCIAVENCILVSSHRAAGLFPVLRKPMTYRAVLENSLAHKPSVKSCKTIGKPVPFSSRLTLRHQVNSTSAISQANI